jgi:ABC-2 type transport system ATP-binding protein
MHFPRIEARRTIMRASMGDSAQAVVVRDLHRTFRKRRPMAEILRHPLTRPARVEALRGVDLTIRTGELFGLLGPNGAGKTTLLKVLCGLVLPGSGEASVHGVDVRRERRIKPLIGLVQSDERSFYWRLTGRENLQFFGRLQGLWGDALRARMDELLEWVGMGGDADRRFGDYSSGMKQRVAIARALLTDPPLVLMDEPTRALDPVHAARTRSFIRDELMEKAGRTVVLATHNLREAELVCDRVGILARGRVREVGTPAELRRWGLRRRSFRLRVAGLGDPLPERLRPAGNGGREEGPGQWYEGTLDLNEPLEVLLEAVRGAGGEIHDCAPLERDLEEVFGRIVDGEGLEAGP